MKPRVYVAGPYSGGDVAMNVRSAFETAEELARRGCAPYVPHANHFWHLIFPHHYLFWMEQDTAWLLVCEAVLRMPGSSPGADKEIALAEKVNIPVFTSVPVLVEHFYTRIQAASAPSCEVCGRGLDGSRRPNPICGSADE